MKLAPILVGLLLLLPGASLRAASKLEPPDLDNYLRWGPVRVRPGFQMSQLGYDDNILFSTARGPVGDYTATFTPKLDGLILFGHRAFFTFVQRFDYTAFAQNRQLNYLNNYTQGRVTVPLQRVGFFVDGLLHRYNFRPVDLETVQTQGVERRIRGGVIFTPGWRTEIEIGQAYRRLFYTEVDPDPRAVTIAERLDRVEQGTTLEARYRIHGRTSAVFEGLFLTIAFENPFVLDDLVIDRDTAETRLLAGFELGRGGPLSGSAKVGWAGIRPDSSLVPGLSEPIGDVRLAYRLAPRTTLHLTTHRLPGFSVYEANAYYVDFEYKLRAVHYFNRLIGLEASGGRGRVTFPTSFSGFEREDRIRRYELGILLRLSENTIGRKVEYSLRIGRYRRNSTDPGVVQSKNTWGFGAVLGF